MKFAQASQTVVGMIPTRIRMLKTWQPRQKANTDSRVAATPMKATRMSAGSSRLKPNQSTVAPTVKTAPIPWANRFGGPGMSLALKGSRGTSTRVTI